MTGIEENFSREPEQLPLRREPTNLQLAELQAENIRLRQIVTELLLRNQQLREEGCAKCRN
jgi:hypothetical protein